MSRRDRRAAYKQANGSAPTNGSANDDPNVVLHFLRSLKLENPDLYFRTRLLKQHLGISVLPTYHLTAADQKLIETVYSEQSYSTLVEVFRAISKSSYNNAMILGPGGVGKTFLQNQLTALLSLGVYPAELGKRLGIGKAKKSTIFDSFIGKTDVVYVDEGLLIKWANNGSAFPKAEERMRDTIESLFAKATQEYRRKDSQGNRIGRRTLFIFEEYGQLHEIARQALKTILDRGGFQDPNDPIASLKDPGFSVAASTTPDEYRKAVQGDSAEERRYVKVKVEEPTELEALAILKSRATALENLHGYKVHESALQLLIRMRRLLHSPVLAMPASVIGAMEDLFQWKTTADTHQYELISRKDAYNFLIDRLHLPPIWKEGLNGEPPFSTLADALKLRVIGQDDLIDHIAKTLKAWIRFGMGFEVPVFYIGGLTGTGKDTLFKALNEVLFGHSGKELMFSVGSAGAGSNSFGLLSITEGPPLGNHSDARPPRLVTAMGKTHLGVIGLNEAYDMSSDQFDVLKMLVEAGNVKGAGIDSREYPILGPILVMGEWGKEALQGLTEEEADAFYEGLTQDKIEKIFLDGQDGGRRGAVSQSNLDRAKRTGGVYLTRVIKRSKLTEIVRLQIADQLGRFAAKGTSAQVTANLISAVVDHVRVDEGPRGLEAVVRDFTLTAVSEAIDQGLSWFDAKIKIDFVDGKVVVTNLNSGKKIKKNWTFAPSELLRSQCSDNFRN